MKIRLFELYGEKLNLLLEKENEYKLNFEKKGSANAIKNVVKIQKATLIKLEKIANVIERQTRDQNVLAKVNYYRSLNYYVVKDYKHFYQNIKKAEAQNKDPKRAIRIYSKLADFHFNEKQFSQAIFYYEKLTRVNNDWKTKVYYNLSWSYLKSEKINKALNYIINAWKLEKTGKYYELGDQLVDSLLLFFAYAKKTKQGLIFLNENNLINLSNLLKYSKYIFESGDKRSVHLSLEAASKLDLTLEEEFQLLRDKVIYYRGLKLFSKVQYEFGQFKKLNRP